MSKDLLFDHFLKQVCAQRDLNWRKYRRASQRKVFARIRELGLAGLQDYANYLERNPQEAAELPNVLRVTVSRFFREKEIWQEIQNSILPDLLRRIGTKRPLRALSIGSCNGQEPYSLALLWKARLEPCFPDSRLNITGLELDEGCLQRARAAFYAGKTLREVPADILSSWFRLDKGGYTLLPEAKNLVDFQRFDLLQEPLPEAQDLIFCRYLVFTYFQGERRLQLTKRIAAALNTRGVLVVGRKEGLNAQERAFFQPVSEAGGIYTKGCSGQV